MRTENLSIIEKAQSKNLVVGTRPLLRELVKRFAHILSREMLSIWVLLLCVWFVLPFDGRAETSNTSPVDEKMEQGISLFHQGNFEEAAVIWTETARLYELAGETRKQNQALINLAQAFHQLGQHHKAQATLELAFNLARQIGDRFQTATILGRLANVAFALGRIPQAEAMLTQALTLAREQENSALTGSLLNDFGNVLAAQDKNSEALGAYTESTLLAESTSNPSLAVRALINAAMASIQEGSYVEAKERLDLAFSKIRTLDPSHEQAYGLLSIGLGFDDLRSRIPTLNEKLLLQASESFTLAAKMASTIGDGRAESYAWGFLGNLYEKEQRYEESLELTRRAILASQQVKAPESQYRWEWQTGRLLKAMGQSDEAIRAYRRAVYTLQPIRHELSFGYQGRQKSFRESVGPLFLELADLLLDSAEVSDGTIAQTVSKPNTQETLLYQARDTIEIFKAAELQDYFKDDCVEATQSRIQVLDRVSETTAIIYPIIFPDRLELLVSFSGGIKRIRVPISGKDFTDKVKTFRRMLEKRTTRQYLPHAQKLYELLIRPLEPDLEKFGIQTLVFVPDGALRTVPMGPLYDGKRFLVEKYAVATTPGLTLTDPQPINRKKIKVLSVGLTEGVQGYPPLPNVAHELNAVRDLYGGPVLLNDQFVVSAMENEMRGEQFTIVHIASHGKFESDVAKSFVLAFDDKLTMDRLDQLVGLFQFRETPLDLLTLSACETAAGDDRAALGLAGIAIKAGARSALATLWFINDKASSDIVEEFYRQLHNPTISKAEALQRAQLKLLKDPAYRHPGYWSPFLLINNWL